MGYYVTKDPAEVMHREHLQRLFSRLKINCVLDVGSHVGDFGSWLRRIGYTGLIVSFEPVPENFVALEQRSQRDSRWRVHRLALGSEQGSAEIRVFAGNTFHSFLDTSEYGRDRFAEKLRLERIEVVAVERLENVIDTAVEGIDVPRIFLKSDTQGYDLEVVRGSGRKIDRIQAMQLELAVRPLYERATNSYANALSELHQLGFQLSGMYPVNYDSDGISLVEFDCVLARAERDVDRFKEDPRAGLA